MVKRKKETQKKEKGAVQSHGEVYGMQEKLSMAVHSTKNQGRKCRKKFSVLYNENMIIRRNTQGGYRG